MDNMWAPKSLREKDLIVKTSNKIESAKTNGVGFHLTFKQVQSIFNNQGYCYYTGAEFSGIGDISFERVNPRLPYQKGNVVLVKKSINSLKGDTIDRFIHESGMSIDAMADLFSLLARSLRKEFNALQEEKINEIKLLEESIKAFSEPEIVENGAAEEVPEGRRQLMNMFIAAKANKVKPNETPKPRSRG